MKQAMQWVCLLLALVLTIGGATVLYQRYGDAYGGGNLVISPEYTSADGTSEAPALTENDVRTDITEATTAWADTEESQEESTAGAVTEGESSMVTEKLEINMQIPDFTVLDQYGNEVRLSDYIGRPIVLNFWATWCGYCKMEMPDFNDAAKAYPDVVFLMVNATDGIYETMESAKAYVEKEGYTFTVLYDTMESAVNAYSVTAFPMTIFIGRDGGIVARGNGMLSRDALEQGIAMIR